MPDQVREVVTAVPSAVVKPEGLSDPAQVRPSAAVLGRNASGGWAEVTEVGAASVIAPHYIAGSDMEDIASVGVSSADVGQVDAGRKRSHVPVSLSRDAPGEELAQAAEGEPEGRGDEPENEAAAVAAPQTLVEPEGLVPEADIRSPPVESASLGAAECTESSIAAVTAEIASREVASSASTNVALAPANDPACCGDSPESDGANEGDYIIPLSGQREPATEDARRLASTGEGDAEGTRDADTASGGTAGAPTLAPGASPGDGVPADATFRADSDARGGVKAEIGSEVVGPTPKASELSAPTCRVAPDENEAGPVEAGLECMGPPLTEAEPSRAPTYRPRLERSRAKGQRRSPAATAEPEYQDLEADLRIIFGPGDWGIELSALLRLPPGAEEVAVLDGQDETWLGAMDDRLLEPLALADSARVLSEGLSIAGVGSPVRWRRSSRGIHVFGAHTTVAGFVSQPRVAIGRENVIICRDEIARAALTQIAATGADGPVRIEGPGVPAGWTCWRGIRPARPSFPKDGPAILHALDPLPAVLIEFVGGLQLSRGKWLKGHPPSIRVLGLVEPDEPVRIDGRLAILSDDGAWSADGWDRQGSHRIEHGGVSATYAIEQGSSAWEWWPAWCDTTALAGSLAVAGEYFHSRSSALLLGAAPGEICGFTATKHGIYVARPRFAPVWLLAPSAGTRRARPTLISAPLTPLAVAGAAPSAVSRWAGAIRSAGYVGARGSVERALWDRYRAIAKKKRRSPR